MPTTPSAWVWWMFSALLVGLALTVGGNLVTPVIKRGGEGWLQKRRLRKKQYRELLEIQARALESIPVVVILPRLQRIVIGITAMLFGIYFEVNTKTTIIRSAIVSIRQLDDPVTRSQSSQQLIESFGLASSTVVQLVALVFFALGMFLLFTEANYLGDLYHVYFDLRGQDRSDEEGAEDQGSDPSP